MEQRIQALNVEIEKFKDFIDKFHLLFAQENFNYNILESQFETIKVRNKKAQEELIAAEQKIKDSLEAAGEISRASFEKEKNVKANIMVLYHKAELKYKELEEKLNAAEKKTIQKHLKELEELAV